MFIKEERFIEGGVEFVRKKVVVATDAGLVYSFHNIYCFFLSL